MATGKKGILEFWFGRTDKERYLVIDHPSEVGEILVRFPDGEGAVSVELDASLLKNATQSSLTLHGDLVDQFEIDPALKSAFHMDGAEIYEPSSEKAIGVKFHLSDTDQWDEFTPDSE